MLVALVLVVAALTCTSTTALQIAELMHGSMGVQAVPLPDETLLPSAVLLVNGLQISGMHLQLYER